MTQMGQPDSSQPVASTSRMQMHPLRNVLNEEVHVRPPPFVDTPVSVSHCVFLADERVLDESFEHIAALAKRFGLEGPDSQASCYYQQLGEFELRAERHTEFCSYTFIRKGVAASPFSETTLSLVPEDWLEKIPGALLTGLHVVVDSGLPPDTFGPTLATWFENQSIVGSHVVDDKALVWTSFRLHSDGFGRFLVYNTDLSDFQAGRTLQRLLDIETYRLLALLALPKAKDIGPRAAHLDKELSAIVDQFSGLSSTEEEHRLLNELTNLAATVEQYRASTNYRFAASRAYHSLVTGGLCELRERKFPGMSTMTKFLERRLLPAMRTCQAVENQLESLSRRIDRAIDLLRARVDVTLESQNQKLLVQMNRRGQLQLRLQQTVEGLSVAAISYYMVGLTKYGLEAGRAAGWPVNVHIGTGIAVPIVIIGVWWLVRRIKRGISTEESPLDQRQ
jgi:uncharacterized membrane-anchored protein